jgi:hypothetical protein
MKSIRGATFRKTQSLRSFFNELDHAELKQFCQALFMDSTKSAQRVYTDQSQGRWLVSHIFKKTSQLRNTVQDSISLVSRICVLDGVGRGTA